MSRFILAIILIVSLSVLSYGKIQHPLSHYTGQFIKMKQKFYNGQTSDAFSIAMKLYVATQLYKSQFKIISSQTSFQNNKFKDYNCHDLLQSIVKTGNQQSWIHRFEQMYGVFRLLGKKCTNMNFKNNKLTQNQLQGGQTKCALCTVLTQVIQNYISYHNTNIADFVQKQFCTYFDGIVKPTCQAFTHYFGPLIIKAILNKKSTDSICLSIGWCTNPDCSISQSFIKQNNIQLIQQYKNTPAPWQWIIDIFVNKFGDRHLPPFDLDNDTFSDVSTFRGYNWRGVDCDQFNKNIYPGRKSGSKILDNDCNGIYGINPKTRKTYQNELCSSSKRLGLAVIGDSAGAHFSIPQKYFNVSMMGKGTFHDLLYRAANQLDIPHQSGYTGNTITHGYQRHSVYKYLRQWNRCNNNDYQNVAVNGGDSGNTWGNIKALKRDQKNDHPLLMIMQLIGNDVCAKSFQSMTKPEQFKANILRLLNYMDTVVPAGSHLMMLGLAKGNILYEYLHDQIHPLNVTYTKVYDFLNCLKISPCWGWLNSNQTVRTFTTQRAMNLSKVYQQIIDQGHKFKNFDIVYYPFPMDDILNRKLMQGGDPKDMIQRCDGFHPNGQFHSYLADWIWNKIKTTHSDWIGQKNIHNQQIKNIFGIKDIN